MSETVHTLKTEGTVWDAIERGEKRFEARRDDRFFQRGDIVCLRRIDENGSYSPAPSGGMFATRDLRFRIGWMLRGERFGIREGFVVFQLEPLEDRP